MIGEALKVNTTLTKLDIGRVVKMKNESILNDLVRIEYAQGTV